ncbi:PD-(D/E)XK nuclease family protein [Lacticaseibacillus nasuensis]|uniref:ATP-dependent nuclease, subunit B n=1 Tax=Lacticaseibacillus nasuensis JCM 17158 TaxID=1291734 RepID=A0A0R1JQA0_9LACO|nr:PD-(D/E)XK nuclease family protein [Lacticaseibacillus nasuensis]KRK73291.1 ATP-dependent nuclease, subunit B [Lacticaseibacillus nasuensis JCM 17158]
MSLQFVLGPASADHQAALATAVHATLQADPQAQVFYLVPNHVKFEAEVALLQALRALDAAADAGEYAQSAVQVLSFTRLAWFFLKNDPVYQQPRLDAAANTMLVAKLLQAHQSELRAYAGEVSHPGFISALARQLLELQLGRISATDLSQLVATMPASDHQQAKFADLAILLGAYEQAVGPYVTTASLLVALSAKLATSDLTHTYIYLNHFNELAAGELQLVQTMLSHAAKVTVALTLDQPATTVPEPPALFLPAAKLYHRLVQTAQEAGVAVLPDQFAEARELTSGVQAVEDFFIADTQGTPRPAVPNPTGLTLAKAADPYTELRTVAQRIQAAVHAGAQYKDFLVLARRLTPYQDIIAPVFAEYNIPIFTDLERPMQQHPLVNLIDSLFAVFQHHYQYQDVMRLLRTELLVPAEMPIAEFRAAVDVTDNHLLRTGLTGSRWLDGQAWVYFQRRGVDPDDLDASVTPADGATAQINQVREFVAATLPPLQADWQAATTGQEAAAALYHWLQTSGVATQLTAWQERATKAGDLTGAAGVAQAWQVLMDLLDDYVTTLGSDPFDLAQFQQLLAAGFAGATYTQIPSTLDQVVVSETGLVRLPKFKHLFLIGATSAAMPAVPDDTGVLTAADRDRLAASLTAGQYLPQQGAAVALGDPFLNYVGLLSADKTVTMSYPVYGESKNAASPYLTGLATRTECALESWQGVTPTTPVADMAGTARSLLADFVRVASAAKAAHTAVPLDWQHALATIRQAPAWHALAIRLAASLDYTNAVGRLAPELATALYGQHLAVSVSRLETYNRNPFEYFLKYGLRLQVRPEFELTPADSGSLYHAVMDQYLRDLAKQGRDLTAVTPAEIADAVAALVTAQSAQPGYEILTSSNSMQFTMAQMTAMLTQVFTILREQQSRSTFRPRRTELLFGQIGQQHGLAPLVLPVGPHQSVTLRGKIDRLDTATVANQTYYLVVDYKSSARQFKPEEAYAGVALQMLTYLDAVGNAEPAGQPAGALYFHLYRPTVPYQPAAAAAAAAFKAYKMVGLLVLPAEEAEAQALALAFDAALAHGGTSPMVPIGLKQNGDFAATTKAITPKQLAWWLNHNRHSIVRAARGILAGTIDLAPIQFKQEATTITNSDYQTIMTFDPATGFDRYRRVAPMSPEALMQHLKEEATDDPIYPEPTSGD